MKHRNRHLTILILTLLFTGLGVFAYRWSQLEVPLVPGATAESWTVEVNMKYMAGKGPVKASFYIPNNPSKFVVLDENFLSRNYGVTTQRENGNRFATWSIRRAHGRQDLYYRVVLYHDENSQSLAHKPADVEKPKFEEPKLQAAQSLIDEIRSRSADITTFTSETIKVLNQSDNNNTRILLNRMHDITSLVSMQVKILSFANIPARILQGIYLKSHTRPELEPWLAIYKDKKWHYFDPKTGEERLPQDYLVWYHGSDPLYTISGGHAVNLNFAVNRNTMNALQLAEERGAHSDSKLIKFSLLSLPVQTQQVFQILLTIPIGAFIILILRHFVGLTTFGTFMPVLIALSFRETELVWGCLLFSFIVACGLLARFYLEQLQLLLVPRLSAVLTLVIMLMIMISVLGHKLGLDRGLSVALFPMVILSMTIERMSILWEERGAADAIKAGIGSLFAASITYLCMHNAQVEYLVFAFPELLLIILAMILTFGQYTGYRLSELVRFKALVQADKRA